jgi:hypothetical protein
MSFSKGVDAVRGKLPQLCPGCGAGNHCFDRPEYHGSTRSGISFLRWFCRFCGFAAETPSWETIQKERKGHD